MQLRRHVPKFLLALATAGSLALVGFLAIASILTVNDAPLAKADVILVLGTAANSDGTPTPMLRSRIERGVALWKEGLAPKLLVTGGAVANAQIEAMSMARYAIAQGVPENAILVEPKARSTRDNAKLAAALIEKSGIGKHVILVTSAYHTRRGRALLTQNGLEVQSVAVPYPAESGAMDYIHYLVHEVGAGVLGNTLRP